MYMNMIYHKHKNLIMIIKIIYRFLEKYYSDIFNLIFKKMISKKLFSLLFQ